MSLAEMYLALLLDLKRKFKYSGENLTAVVNTICQPVGGSGTEL